MSKYRSVKTDVNGIRFSSKREAKRYVELRLLQAAGHIKNLHLQQKFPIEVNGCKICTYIADFCYIEKGLPVVEDVKGMRTSVYRLKAKLMRACYDINIRET